MGNKYKLVCLDLDGTLLNSNRKISFNTLNYLRKLINRGIIVSIATGRPCYDAMQHALDINDKAYYIGSNGAAGGFAGDGRLLFESSLSDALVDQLMNISKHLKLKPVFYTEKQTIVLGFKDFIMHQLFIRRGNKRFLKHLKFISGTKKFLRYIKEGNYKLHKSVIFLNEKNKHNKAKDILAKHEDIEWALTYHLCYEITANGINKSYGIKQLTEHLRIKPNEVIAFGDSENDREMLKFVGVGVAMGNADKSIKDIADVVTDTNDNDGIVKMLKKIFE